MATTAGSRKTISVHDYPEHLNPFHEEDNHNKIRFWTIGRKLNRSNSINFSGIKTDLKNSWAFRSFMRKGKKEKTPKTYQETPYNYNSQNHHNGRVNGESSPIVYRRALQYSSASTAGARNTVGSPERPDRYVYGGSITPLPRSRFQERLRSSSQYEVSNISGTPRMARSEVSGSRLSVESTNPFDEYPVPPVRASRRKKKRAPPPPSADVSMNSTTSELEIKEDTDQKIGVSKVDDDLDIEKFNVSIELKIIEDEDVTAKPVIVEETIENTTNKDIEPIEAVEVNVEPKTELEVNENTTEDQVRTKPEDQIETDLTETINQSDNQDIIKEDDNKNLLDEEVVESAFPKVDIVKYRRNSSLNEDDIKLRRDHLENIHSLSNKRSKSMSNALESRHVTYDINLNENMTDRTQDDNGNEEPQKVVCKLYDDIIYRKPSIDTISSTEKEFIEIDKATKELEKEISKLNSALANDEDILSGTRLSVSDIRKKFDQNGSPPNPIPKPKRSNYGDSTSPVTFR